MKSLKLLLTCLTVILALFMIATPVLAAGELIKSDANPVLFPTETWEGTIVGAPCVILDAGVYKMWYSGMDIGFPAIGYAESVDGLSWTKELLPVMLPGAPADWDSDGVGGACVIKDGGLYKMWYTGVKGLVLSIGYAESPDGLNWTKIGGAAVLTSGLPAAWDSDGVAMPSVIKDGAIYKMWFTGRKDTGGLLGTLAIGYADSVDGTTWVKYGANPVLQANLFGWDNKGVGAASVKKIGTVYRMYYTGFTTTIPIAHIGDANSLDEVTWSNAVTPALFSGDPGEWDDMGVGAPTFILNAGNTELWYTGTSEESMQIGQAHTDNPAGVPAGSTLSTIIMIAGFVVLMGGVSVWGLRRNSR